MTYWMISCDCLVRNSEREPIVGTLLVPYQRGVGYLGHKVERARLAWREGSAPSLTMVVPSKPPQAEDEKRARRLFAVAL